MIIPGTAVMLFLVCSGLIITVHSDTRPASSCSQADVQAAINTASDGDTVFIPNGSCTWNSGISTSKQISLCGSSVGGVTITHGAGTATLIALSIGTAHHTTIANLRFMPGTGTGQYVQVAGSGLVPLMHDCYFNMPHFQIDHAVHWYVTGGVIWQTTFESTQSGGSGSGCLVVRSNRGWETASTIGALDVQGDQNLYIEDCTFRDVGQCPDVDDAGRVVVRHCEIIASEGLTHGSTGMEGGRHIELYNNAFRYPDNTRNINRYFWWRAGTGVVTDNTIDDIKGQMWGDKSEFVFAVENAARPGNFGCCTAYPCFHQCGFGHNGVSQVSDPVYFWNNSGTFAVGLNNGEPDECPGSYGTADFFQQNRDYFIGTAKPGYVKYTYPHPLRSSGTAIAGSSVFSVPSANRNERYVIYDLSGRAVAQMKDASHGNVTMKIGHGKIECPLSNGLYLVRIIGSNNAPLNIKRMAAK